MKRFVAILRLVAIVTVILLALIPLILFSLIGSKAAIIRLSSRVYRILLVLCNVVVLQEGSLSEKRPLLLVANHTSWLDIFVLGGSLPVRFTPKSEIANWPIVGRICKMTGCVFVRRNAHASAELIKSLKQESRGNSVVCLFPEGTTGLGQELLNFHSTVFALAAPDEQGQSIALQPATIRYRYINGDRLSDQDQRETAWIDDDLLLPHILRFLAKGGVRAEIILHPLLTPAEKEIFNRKALAARCREMIQTSL